MVKDIAKYIDYTLLKADAPEASFEKLCREAQQYGFYSVCVPPYAVSKCRNLMGAGGKIAAVISFPLGYSSCSSKVFETGRALKDGADEIDAVINISAFKSGMTDYVLNELKEIRKAAAEYVLKIIIETCYMNDKEIIALCGLVSESGADFIKTSTGFGPRGADIKDIELIKRNIPARVKIKASGGIKTFEQAASFIKAGASRIGTSSMLIKRTASDRDI